MRVIAGTARSLNLVLPEGLEVRPTIDRYKETVFNILNQRVVGAEVLDLFAGSGANGIEALSRGAASAVFVENGMKAIESIERNLKFTKLFEKATLMKYDCTKALMVLKEYGRQFDLIYLDPPFNGAYENQVIDYLLNEGLLAEGGIIVCESDRNTVIEVAVKGYEIYKEKSYKTCKFTFVR